MGSRTGEGGGSPAGVKPGALTDLLRQVAVEPVPRQDDAPPLLPGAVVGRFEIVRELGRGAFGVVYAAKDRDLGRQVALKLVRPGAAAVEDGKVLREAEAVARLSHPNLVTLHDVGRSDAGPYLVFELLHGKTLQARVDDGPLPLQEAVHVAVEVARGLAHAHAEGVVHRDLKPSNVFVTDKGLVKILDFGMAHAFGRRRLSGGTPAYMAPEQWEDDPEDERTDVFALGVMLYRMLSGEYPFPEGGGRWSAGPAVAPRLEVPGAQELADLVDRMLERAPKGRPRDGAAVLAALLPIEEALRSKPADGSPPVHANRRKATLAVVYAELKRRRVFRALAGYGLVAFAVLQVVEPVMHGLGLPEWVLKVVVIGLVLGLPLTILLAWAYDLKATGIERTPSAWPGGLKLPRVRVAALLAGAGLVAALPGIGWYAWTRGREAAGTAAEAASIAVLPFDDLSEQHNQAYLADGVAEEILTALTRVEGLKVIGRTSAFSLRDQHDDLSTLGRRLGAAHVLQGSLRKEGAAVRVTAQLVRVTDGVHLWSDRYDRQLVGIFKVQDEIAQAIVGALKVRLLPGADPPTSTARSASPEAYEQYLMANQALMLYSPGSAARAAQALERALALDPELAPAWASLSVTLALQNDFRSTPEAVDGRRRAVEAADRAVALGPRLAEAYASRARVRNDFTWDFDGADRDSAQAVALAPGSATALVARCYVLRTRGRFAESAAACQRATELDPLSPRAWNQYAWSLLAEGDLDRARASNDRALALAPGSDFALEVRCSLDVVQARRAGAGRSCRRIADATSRLAWEAILAHDDGRSREAEALLARVIAEVGPVQPYYVADVMAWTGRADLAFEWLERCYRDRVGLNELMGDVLLAKLRADPRYTALLRKVGLPPAPGEPAPTSPSIAVLPFADMSPQHDQEYFADGMAEEILNALARVDGLRVAGRTSAFAFKGKNEDLVAIAQKLRVGSVMEGSVRVAGRRVRITAQLINAADGFHIWSQTYDRDLTSVLAIQDEIARAVAGALKVRLLPGRAQRPETNPEAYRLYLLALQVQSLGTVEAADRAVTALRQASRIAPEDARVHAQLALMTFARWEVGADLDPRGSADLRAWWRGLVGEDAPSERVSKVVLAMAERAVALGPDMPEPYAVRGYIRHMQGWDWPAARADEERALALAPGDVPARIAYARLLATTGHLREALDLMERVVEDDPLRHQAWLWRGILQTATGHPELGETSCRRGLELTLDTAYLARHLAFALMLQDRAAEALALAERHPVPWHRWQLVAMAQHQLGHEEASRKALGQLTSGGDAWAFQIAQAHAWRGEKDRAFEWLERGFASNDPGMRFASFDPMLRGLRGDPRYAALLRKMNLPAD